MLLLENYEVTRNTTKKYIERRHHPKVFLQEWEMEIKEWTQTLGLGMKKKGDGRYALME